MRLSKEIKVGLLAVVALVILYLGVPYLRGIDIWKRNHTYYTTYANSRGLNTASPVFLNGLVVGKVKSIHILPEDGYQIQVTFVVNKDIVLTQGTKAVLINSSILGGKAIRLVRGEGEIVQPPTAIPGEMEIPLTETFESNALPILNNAKDISLLTQQLLANLANNMDRVNGIIANLEATTHQLNHHLHGNREEITAISQNLAKVMSDLSDQEHGIAPLLTNLNSLVSSVDSHTMAESVTHLNSLLKTLTACMAQDAATGDTNLSKLIHDHQLYDNLNETLVGLNEVLIDVRKRPWRYVHFSVFGRKGKRK